MGSWLDRFRKRPAPPALRGAPPQPRLKNYAALSGYAYEYVYEGMRDVEQERQYVFRVSGDRRNWFYLSIALRHDAIRRYETANARVLAENEKYAIAKMALFSAFDERPNPEAMREPVVVECATVEALVAQLGLDA